MTDEARLRDEVEQLQAKNGRLEDDLYSASREHDRLHDRIEELEARVNEQNHLLSESEDAVEQANTALQTDLDSWEGECSRYLRQIAFKCGFEHDLDGDAVYEIAEYILAHIAKLEARNQELEGKL